MAKKTISRLYDFQAGEVIRSTEVDNELNQLVEWLNKTMDPMDWDGVQFYVVPSRVKDPTWTTTVADVFNADGTVNTQKVYDPTLNNDVSTLLNASHNPDGTVKSSAITDPDWTPTNLKDFLSVAHHNDGTIKSTGINDPLIEAHNGDFQAHPYNKAFSFFLGG